MLVLFWKHKAQFDLKNKIKVLREYSFLINSLMKKQAITKLFISNIEMEFRLLQKKKKLKQAKKWYKYTILKPKKAQPVVQLKHSAYNAISYNTIQNQTNNKQGETWFTASEE